MYDFGNPYSSTVTEDWSTPQLLKSGGRSKDFRLLSLMKEGH